MSKKISKNHSFLNNSIPETGNLDQIKSEILDKIFSKLDKLALSVQKSFKDQNLILELIMACLGFAAQISSKIGLTEEGFLSLCRHIFKDMTANSKTELN